MGEGRKANFIMRIRDLTVYRSRKEAARELRQQATKAERILWSRLKNRRLAGFKFRRQFPMGSFFLDFCCLEKRLVVEVDGLQHFFTIQEDANRTHFIRENGFHVMRFWNVDVLNDVDAVCEKVRIYLKMFPLPSGEGPGRQTSGDRGVRQHA
jgi:very-short-patch-repair endonuclease